MYLKPIGKQDNESCWYCQERDTPEHTLFICQRWVENCNKAETIIRGRIMPKHLMEKNAPETSWETLNDNMITNIIKRKTEDERNNGKAI